MLRPEAGLAMALCLALVGTSQGQEPAPFFWRADLAAARLKAKEEGRPLLVVFR